MPREVFAEEIERFLGTLAGVASARVFTTPAGGVAQVYVTAENTADTRVVRRGVATALVSTYGLPVEPWQIQVTQFRGGLRPSEIPRFRVLRVEENLSVTEMEASVQVTWTRGSEERSATGRARGPAGPACRLRTLATATVDAVRDALEPAHRRVSVQQAAFATFLDRPIALVGIAVPTPGGPVSCIGAAGQEEMPEVVVAAALDAVTKWLLQSPFSGAAPQAADRREHLEAMRHFIRAGEEAGVVSDLLTEVAVAGAHAVPDAPAHAAGHAPETDAAPDAKPLRGDPAERYGAHDPDVLTDLSELRPEKIRPEKRGGTAMSVHQEPSRAGLVPPRAGRPSMEETFYQSLVDGQTPVHLRCRDGYEVPRATVKDVGTYTLLVETAGGAELVFKHAIISIRPLATQTPEA